ncbi:GroES-like zinc-binding alcohol dehydrogenase family protein [Gossypium australe]|uniref:GroES-like zinc-binding alcohol dehydrogenase family protein n=1 Tax=Gossypium australe TaxID=47621 RepID=A0A5B6VH87_9ROSI|nr:GroES-like zinc-binding alcohol dehydrogenase family protein [Gossypium australe]
MDIENGYYLVKLHSTYDYTKVLSQGPWLVYGQYLTVQPWTKEFSPSQPFPNIVLAWIRLPGLPGYLYKKKIIEEIGGLIGKVVRLDLNTNSKTRGRFARMVVYINLDKPLTVEVLINGMKQRVEYESLPEICFNCGKYGHIKEFCPRLQIETTSEKVQAENIPLEVEKEGEEETYGPWMVVDRKSMSYAWKNNIPPKNKNEIGKSSSRFQALAQLGRQEEMEYGHNQRSIEEERGQVPWEMIKNNNGTQLEGVKIPSGPSAPRNNPTFNKIAERPQRIHGNKIANEEVGPILKSKTLFINGTGSPFNNKIVSHSPPTNDFSIATNSQNLVKVVADSPKAVLMHTNNGVGSTCANKIPHNAETGSSTSQPSFNGLNNKSNMKVASFQIEPMHGELARKEVQVEVGCLDPGKHTAVVFHESKNRNSKMSFSLASNFNTRTGLNNKGKGIAKKRNKVVQGKSTRLKINGVQRVSLKESMEEIAESLSILSNTNSDLALTN